MSDSLNQQFLRVADEPVLSLAEFRSYLDGLREDQVPPSLLTEWMAGADVNAGELLDCFRGEAADLAAGSDEALEIVRLAIDRMTKLFSSG